MSETEHLPALPSEITAEWLSAKLRLGIRSIENTRNIWGTASKMFYTITYEDEQAPKGSTKRPVQVCIKGVFDPETIDAQPWTVGQAQREAEFFDKLAPAVNNMVLPRGWWSGKSERQGIVIMSDLSREGCTFPPEVAAYPVEIVKRGVEQLAGLHAQYWGQSQKEHEWIWNNYDPTVQYLGSLWESLVSGPGRPILPSHLSDGARCSLAVQRYCNERNSRFRTLLHGDAHMGNIYFTSDNRIGFLDWSAIHFGSCFHDVAYHMTSMLSVEDRRAHEWEILAHYLEALHRFGGPRLDWKGDKEVIIEFKRSFMANMMWLVCPYGLQSKERVLSGIERAVAACDGGPCIA